jgi:protein gp37
MADKSKIEWTDATWNIVTGCSIVSPGCTNCYAMRLAGARLREHPSRKGLTKVVNGKPVWTGEVRFNEQWLKQPLEWKKPRRIFVAAHGDLFHENVPDDWIDRVFAVMALAPWHSFMVLTKRASRMRRYFNGPYKDGTGVFARVADATWAIAPTRNHLPEPPTVFEIPVGPRMKNGEPEFGYRRFIKPGSLPNVWLGVTAEDQQRADERIPDLLATPAAKRFVSIEPMLGPVDLTTIESGWSILDDGWDEYVEGEPILDLVICGGESGRGSRPMYPDWARGLRDQCEAAGVPFFFKQWGEWFPRSQWEHNPELFLPDDDDAFNSNSSRICRFEDEIYGMEVMHRVGKRRAGRLLDGVEHNEFPR